MGCNGIGVTRVVAAAIEQNNDDKGIIWPQALAPFQVGIVALNYDKSELVRETADQLYQVLTAQGIEVLLDDRDKKTSPGVKMAEMELIGIPHRLVVGERGLKEGLVEYQRRRDLSREDVTIERVLDFLQVRLNNS